jgi:hypothetical protein
MGVLLSCSSHVGLIWCQVNVWLRCCPLIGSLYAVYMCRADSWGFG